MKFETNKDYWLKVISNIFTKLGEALARRVGF